jgi:hypothetical protein
VRSGILSGVARSDPLVRFLLVEDVLQVENAASFERNYHADPGPALLDFVQHFKGVIRRAA